MGEHTVVAVDVAKDVFELAVSEEPGRVKLHRRLSRGELEVFFAQARKSTVVMEACWSAHHWGDARSPPPATRSSLSAKTSARPNGSSKRSRNKRRWWSGSVRFPESAS